MAEFKIGRLRFSWQGTWQSEFDYNRDMIVQYNGKSYVCIVPHTSGDFNQDIVHYTPAGEFTPYWSKMVDGRSWVGTWNTNTSYGDGNIVIFGGIAYLCIQPHNSGSTFVLENWNIYGDFNIWKGNWTVSTVYGIGDIIKYGGVNYICTAEHTSSATIELGLEPDIFSWAIFNKNIQYKGEWAPNYRYKFNDMVKFGPNIWLRLWISPGDPSSYMSGDTFNDAHWTIWLPGLDYNSIWDAETTYDKNDTIRYGGYLYVNNITNNIGNVPSVDSLNWSLVTTAYELKDDWNNVDTYKVGSVVRYSGRLYSAISDNVSQNPVAFSILSNYTASGSSGTTLKVTSTIGITVGMNVVGVGFTKGQTVVSIIDDTTVTINEGPDTSIYDNQALTFVGINYVYWKLLIPGIHWSNKWTSNIAYSIGDLVTWKNGTYKCITNHTSGISNPPDLDTLHSFWVLFLQHDIYNGTNDSGDFLIRNNGQNVPLPIGTLTNVLKTINSTPAWDSIFVTPNVFYVATNGEDLPTNGTTWDIPWKTVAYACDQVGKGTMNPYSRMLITENIEYIIAELYNWIARQQINNSSPFSSADPVDIIKTKRDARYIVDAIIYDLSKGGNSQIVAAALSFFKIEKPNMFFSDAVASKMPKFIASLSQLFTIISSVLTNSVNLISYQVINGVASPILQITNNSYTVEQTAISAVSSATTIIISALSNQDTSLIPSPNVGLSSTIFIKSGTYSEMLPITIPENVTLMGDEIRSVVIQPGNIINTLCTHTDDDQNVFTVETTVNMENNTPVQFVSINPITDLDTTLGGITPGQTYYVIGSSITPTSFAVSEEIDTGIRVTLLRNTGFMHVYGGNALSNMFYVRNGTGIRNMTLTGLLGSLTAENQFLTRRPTGGAYVSLDPGTSPDDVSAWIFRRSPYVQNVTTFGTGAVGLKIDSTLHNGGNRSVVCNDFTQIISDGIGIWCYGGDALCEAVSVFSYYGYAGYLSENGGKIRATNGNSSYGTFGVVSEGYDTTETPISGIVNNHALQAVASAVSSLGTNSNILKIQYDHAGNNYSNKVTNLLLSSNNFINNWATDGNLNIAQNIISPSGLSDGWMLTATTGAYDGGYVQQGVSIPPFGGVYNNISGTNEIGSGIGATFIVTVTSDTYQVSVSSSGSGYVVGNTIRLYGNLLGGILGTNDIVVTVQSLVGTGIQTVSIDGVVPSNSVVPYTLSLYCKKGNATSMSIYAFFLGYSTKGSSLTFNFDTATASVAIEDGLGVMPTQYTVTPVSANWYRVSFTVYDVTAQNTTLQFRIYPRTRSGGVTGYSYVYGAQIERGSNASFYLETGTRQYSNYANLRITGAGTGVVVESNEIRSKSAYQIRIVNNGLGLGGSGYTTSSNNAQGGTSTYITLAQSDVKVANNYIGMRIFVNSGTGAGQYGFISAYDAISKNAYVLKESITPLTITNTTNGTNLLTLDPTADISTLYINQQIQFVPLSFNVAITSVGQDQIIATEAIGGTVNTITVSNTSKLRVGMAISFTGNVFSNITINYLYYIVGIIDATTINISTSYGGAIWGLVSATGSMILNYPDSTSYITGSTTNMNVNYSIQFTGNAIAGIEVGTTYYIQDIIDSNNFTMASSLVSVIANATTLSNSTVSIDTSVNLKSFTPIVFTGTSFGGIVANTKYYVNNIPSVTSITLTDSLISRVATATASVSNLITVTSTAGFVAGNPIIFIGPSFGGIVNEQVYYIQVVNDAVSFTISTTSSGAAYNLTDSVGSLIVKTASSTLPVTTASGSMVGTSTSPKIQLSAASGIMVGTFSAPLFGGISAGTSYYIKTINVGPPSTITITATSNGATAVTLPVANGLMQIGEVGWDHINPGTPPVVNFDSSSVYVIEPKVLFSAPDYTYTSVTTTITSASIAQYGDNKFIIVQNSNSSIYASSDGIIWTSQLLPVTANWTSIAYGNKVWVIISNAGSLPGSTILISASNGDSWKTANLPVVSTWNKLVFGNGTFVAIASSSSNVAYSSTYGVSWTLGTGLSSASWIDIAYGAGRFVAIASSSNTAAYSTNNGSSWTTITLPITANWSSIEYGNNRFVAIASTSATPIYSFDGVTWYQSSYSVAASKLTYGNGVFFAVVNAGSTVNYTSETGILWTKHTGPAASYTDIAFGYNASTYESMFIGVSASSAVDIYYAGCRTQARAVVTNGLISKLSLWEPGSNYTTPSLVVTDPNNTNEVATLIRIGNGVLSNPSFISRGSGYNTTSTSITITGDGYADDYQTGITLYCKNLSALPAAGDNLSILGNSQVYKVAKSTILNGTTAPNLQALIQLSPGFTTSNAPEHGTAFIIRTKYSQVRLTNHDFLNIGYGDTYQSNYPNLPFETDLQSQNQTIETNDGRVFYSSTDQDGNFKVGELFAVEQATGIVTLSASQFGLEGLTQLKLGGVAVGASAVVITQFSTDPSFLANSNAIIPTQKAIKSYLAARLSQGGSNTFTGQLTAGTVVVGGPNKIASTLAEGNVGASVKVTNKVNINGIAGGVDGDLAALSFFVKSWKR